MKKAIYIFLALAAASCNNIREDFSDCPAYTELVFVLDDPYSSGDFDSDIANDIFLQIFEGGSLVNTITIPYDQIEGGKPYRLQKTAGRMQLLAYAIPAGEPGAIPAPQLGASYSEQAILMEALTGSPGYAPREGSLYLGKINIEEDLAAATTHRVSMAPCFAKVTVIVMDAGLFGAHASQMLSVGIEGTSGRFMVAGGTAADPVEIISGMTDDAENCTTGAMRLLPPVSPGTKAKANLYFGGSLVMYVETGEELIAGREVVIRIYPHNFEAEITVDGWTYKTQAVEP